MLVGINSQRFSLVVLQPFANRAALRATARGAAEFQNRETLQDRTGGYVTSPKPSTVVKIGWLD